MFIETAFKFPTGLTMIEATTPRVLTRQFVYAWFIIYAHLIKIIFTYGIPNVIIGPIRDIDVIFISKHLRYFIRLRIYVRKASKLFLRFNCIISNFIFI